MSSPARTVMPLKKVSMAHPVESILNLRLNLQPRKALRITMMATGTFPAIETYPTFKKEKKDSKAFN